MNKVLYKVNSKYAFIFYLHIQIFCLIITFNHNFNFLINKNHLHFNNIYRINFIIDIMYFDNYYLLIT